MTDDEKGKRQFPRVPVSLQVSYLSKGDLQKDLVDNLSPGGLFVHTTRPLDIGTDVDLEVLIADEDTPIHVRGKVVWLRPQPGQHPGMGIQFTGVMGPLLLEMVNTTKNE
ncbi:MAG: type pilus assembly PilZ [Myxococcales bacterium]|nr:type pilus assembly PilZ [Myxococcales bacterium]